MKTIIHPVLSFIWHSLEAFIWMAALAWLAFQDPHAPHLNLCLFNILGFEHCPGCGLGHSLGFLLRGNLQASWNAHYLAFPALLILCYRIVAVLHKSFKFIKLKEIIYGTSV